jgi:hypothetical protein
MGRLVVPAFLVLAALAAAEEPPAPAGFLPTAEEMNGWEPVGEVQLYPRGRLHEYLNGGAPVLEEYGLEVAAIREWKRGEEIVAFHVYRMTDDTAACGLFTQVRTRMANDLAVGDGGFESAGCIGLWKGRWYAQLDRLRGNAGTSTGLRTLARRVAARLPGEGAEPPLLTVLRTPTMVPRSEVLLRGPLALGGAAAFGKCLAGDGFRLAATASYKRGDATTRVLIADYASEEAAGAALGALAKTLGVEDTKDALLSVESESERILAWRKGSRVRIVVR